CARAYGYLYAMDYW
nr:immunoglobulin heavy chain junction region [Mus musculus]